MHELILTQNILEVALGQTAKAGAERVVRINLSVGPMCDENEDSIRFHWGELAARSFRPRKKLFRARPAPRTGCGYWQAMRYAWRVSTWISVSRWSRGIFLSRGLCRG